MSIEIYGHILETVKKGDYRITQHATEEMAADELGLEEVIMSLTNGEIIEYYPDDFPFPSCLIYGKGSRGKNIHSVWAFDELKRIAILITVNRPDQNRWIDFRFRR